MPTAYADGLRIEYFDTGAGDGLPLVRLTGWCSSRTRYYRLVPLAAKSRAGCRARLARSRPLASGSTATSAPTARERRARRRRGGRARQLRGRVRVALRLGRDRAAPPARRSRREDRAHGLARRRAVRAVPRAHPQAPVRVDVGGGTRHALRDLAWWPRERRRRGRYRRHEPAGSRDVDPLRS